jgi:kinesin family protein 18/19
MQDNSNIVVTVRVRPLSREEDEKNGLPILRAVDEHVIVFDPKDVNQTQRRGVPNHSTRPKDCQFAFDHVFNGISVTAIIWAHFLEFSETLSIFNKTARILIDEVLNGFNCTCFAYVRLDVFLLLALELTVRYGATGSGKTHTMIGNSAQPGIMVLTMNNLFRKMEENLDRIYDVKISYLEVYNETISEIMKDRMCSAYKNQ